MLVTQETDLFSRPQQIFTTTHRERVEVLPVMRTDEVCSFEVPKSNRSFTSSGLILRTRWCIMDGQKKLPADANVAGISLCHHGMWQNITVQVNETTVFSTVRLGYTLASYLQRRFCFNDASRISDSYLTLKFPDSSGHFEDFNPERKVNLGYEKRKMILSGSNMVTTSDFLMIPFTQSGRLLPPGVSISIHMQRAPNAVALCSPSAIGKNYRIAIESCVLEVERCHIMEPLVSRIYNEWRTSGGHKILFY